MILLTIKAVKTFLNYYVSKKTFFEKISLTLGKGLKVTHIFFYEEYSYVLGCQIISTFLKRIKGIV